MASFKILKGSETNLPSTGLVDGAVYYCEDSGNSFLGNSDGSRSFFLSGAGRRFKADEGFGGIMFGEGLAVTNENAVAIGAYNADADNLLFSVGNGNSSNTKNAFSVSNTGDVMVSNTLTTGSLFASDNGQVKIPVKSSGYTSSTPGEIWIVNA